MSEITAKNYVGQVIKEFQKYATYSEIAPWIPVLKAAQHFALPDGGLIFDGGSKGLYGVELNLPFDICTLEICTPEFDYGKKQVILLIDDPKNEAIVIYQILSMPDNGEHIGTPLFLPNQAGARIYKTEFIDLVGDPKIEMLDWTGKCPGVNDPNETSETITLCRSSISTAAKYVLEFLEAMSCKNVETVTYQKASPNNAQRIKSRKAPIYETKILSLVMPQKVTKGEKLFGTHASPRQHLRRGHIRRLDTGNIWVNACVVGDASNGIINKQYKVSA
jgi:hypothetical protein